MPEKQLKGSNMKIKSVYDNKGETIDRYSIVFNETETYPNGIKYHTILTLSHNPSSPQGVSMFGHGLDGKHLGDKIKFSDLPENIQSHIKERIN
jgi:hypothetical protein